MEPDQLNLLHSVGTPTLHPDGGRAVFAVTRPDFDADAYVGQLWELQTDSGSHRRLTRGFRDTAPQFSPNGSLLGFLRSRPGDKPQLHLMDARGGEPLQVTDQPLGVEDFRFAPDSRSIVFVARVPEAGRYGTVEGVGASAEDPRRITTFQYRANGLGYTADKRAQLFLVDVPSLDAEPFIEPVGRAAKDAGADRPGPLPEPVQLTSDPADHNSPRFTSDGARILFTAALSPDADSTLASEVYSVRRDGTGREQLSGFSAAQRLDCAAPVQSRDGRWLFYLAGELSATGLDFVARNTGLYAAPMDSPGEARRLTDAETVNLGEVLEVVPHGDSSVLVISLARGACELLEVDADGTASTLVDGPVVVTGAASAAGRVLVSYTGPGTAGDAALVGPDGLEPLTDFSAELRSATTVSPAVEETFPAPDGAQVHGWVLLPEGEGPHPVLLNIHGGPFSQYGWGYFDEAQVYARAGYAVLMCNPRGSAGYGQEHGRAIKEAMGTLDLQDVLAFLEGALGKYAAMDGSRVGIMGGSYGGYLTAWTISQDHRFTAAIVERGYLDPPSFVGSSDIGWFFSDEYTGTDPEKVRSQNPFAQIGSVDTPTFVIHSEEDLRCPVEQAQRYYTALKKQGVPTELLLFPGENHELSRSGTPWHRRQRFEHILRWWAEWLPSGRNQRADSSPER
ncbi:MAG: Acylamino-acid-releasing enzyme [uncultured Arthrobacter sp.]|uniref:Acylamino-acid-releasing enzyme n=1 Tax=uncultured Arthrobacter sp. TaxID=114050 RepID=A0A6J4JDI0_9MICC|nr:S9 family peptidase [uncultured Arthrobacter sp.]CAA9273746.1 MAG: Acylamino-acid-releasing enzyme [uncultured Arthrobacter sp.]